MNDPCKLLVVDDSKIMRRLITDLFESDDKIHVVGEAADGLEALASVSRLVPRRDYVGYQHAGHGWIDHAQAFDDSQSNTHRDAEYPDSGRGEDHIRHPALWSG
ncbi:response regulator [Candidatus Competibacter phosphatis]|uniref:Response regulator n=1 Tax=Candidatus Competibacter phosphatis TaxID=221280 RepID=A0ABX1TPK8_9GAMM|nr:response regulator [Candidatus Competibacter phosphatis]